MSLINEAIALHQNGELDAAEQIYRSILAEEPVHADALHLLGLIHYVREEYKEAINNVKQAIEYAPDNAVYSFNLGNIYQQAEDIEAAKGAYLAAISNEPANAEYRYELANMLDANGQAENAVEYYEQAVLLEPDNAFIHLDFGACYQALQQWGKALAQYQSALSLEPTLAQAHNNMGSIFQTHGELDKASECYRKAIESDPELAESHRNYAGILVIQGDKDAALQHYQEALRVNPDYHEVAYKIAALQGDEVPLVAPSEYVAQLFDQYAEEFDEHLTGVLQYQTPQLLRQLFNQLHDCSKPLRIMDLGCGTGLSGEAFKDCAEYLAGVDISPRMVEKAGERNIYNELTCGDVVQALQESENNWHLILAADVLVYIGDLEEVMGAAVDYLHPDGSLLFSVERSDEKGFRLGESGRYAHSLDYINRLAEKHALAIRMVEESVIRKEYGNDVTGYLIAMQKT